MIPRSSCSCSRAFILGSSRRRTSWRWRCSLKSDHFHKILKYQKKGIWGFPKLGVPHSWLVFVNGKIPSRNGWLGGIPISGNHHMAMCVLVGGSATPLKNMTSSIGMMKFPIFLGKCQKMATSHHQPVYGYVWIPFFIATIGKMKLREFPAEKAPRTQGDSEEPGPFERSEGSNLSLRNQLGIDAALLAWNQRAFREWWICSNFMNKW